ncbi:MAG: tetratricopeptide repeat protein [Phycisphaerae bacterium]|nr:tetratricopeptide repeat protein [Phycisphaerae bacterium]
MAPESPVAAIERLLREGRALDALAVAEPLAAKNPRMLQAWLGVARAKLHLGWIAEADEALERLDAFAASDPQVALLRGLVHQRLGRIDQAADRLRAVATGRSLQAVEASVALGELF